MRGCEKEKMICVDVKMKRCTDLKMHHRPPQFPKHVGNLGNERAHENFSSFLQEKMLSIACSGVYVFKVGPDGRTPTDLDYRPSLDGLSSLSVPFQDSGKLLEDGGARSTYR